MDKHIIYMPMKQAVGGYQHVAGGCLCSTGKECEYAKGEECQTWAIVNPAELAKVEAEARIGRAVEEKYEALCVLEAADCDLSCAQVEAMRVLSEVIARAREA